MSDVYLYTVDDLGALVQVAGEKRQAAVAQAEAIIETGVQSFAHWLDQRASIPLIQALHAQADDWRAAEIARARKLLARGEDVDAVLDALARGLTQKMLHGTLAELHGADQAQRQATGADGDAAVPARNQQQSERRSPVIRRRIAAEARAAASPAHRLALLLLAMNDLLRQRFERLALRQDEVDAILADPAIGSDMARFRTLARERSEIAEALALYHRHRQRQQRPRRGTRDARRPGDGAAGARRDRRGAGRPRRARPRVAGHLAAARPR